jgi:hypothetical protein
MALGSGVLPGWFRGKRAEAEESPPALGKRAGSTTGGGSTEEPVVVWSAATRLEAEVVAGRLQSEGIPALIQAEALGAIYGLTTGSLAAATVSVPAPLADKALEILTTDVDWEDESDFQPDHQSELQPGP